MAFAITPDSYVFNNINESSTFIITTDNEDYKFEFVNTTSPGNGRVALNRETNTITSTAYGRGRYRFVDGDDVYPFNIEVKRPEIPALDNVTKVVEIGEESTINYTPPDGYIVVRYEAKDLDNSTVTIGTSSYQPSVSANKLGKAEYEIVLSKISTGDGTQTAAEGEEGRDDTNVDSKENQIEYNGGTITFEVVNFVMEPKDTTVSRLLKEEFTFDMFYINIDENNTRGELTFDSQFDGAQHNFKLDVKDSI